MKATAAGHDVNIQGQKIVLIVVAGGDAGRLAQENAAPTATSTRRYRGRTWYAITP